MERFCTQTLKVPFNNRVFFNSETFIKIPKSGDAISKIRLVLDIDFVNNFEEEIIREAELIIDGNSTEKLYGEFLHIENQLITPIEKRALLSNLLCTNSQGTLYLDLSFVCVKNKLFELSEDTQLRLLFANSLENDELFGYLLVDYIVTDENSIPKQPYFKKNRKLSQLSIFADSPSRIVADTYIPGSVYELFFTVKNSSGQYVDALKNVTLLIGNNERFNTSGYILRYIEPLKIYKRFSQSFPVYVYSFRLDEESGGQTHLTDRQRFIFDFFDNNQQYTTTIWAQSHDFFYKNYKTKSVFVSDELVLFSSVVTTTNYQSLDISTSYSFYANKAQVSYTGSSVDIQNVQVTSTNVPSYTITQNEIIFRNIDSLSGNYYANVVFSSSGFADTTCYFTFKSPAFMNNYINDRGTSFSDVLFSGNPLIVIDGSQRFNVCSGNTLNGVSTPVNGISSLVIDQFRDFLVSNSTQVNKIGSYTVSGDDYYGIPSTYFGTEIIPSTNVFYTYTNNILSNTNTISSARIHCCALVDYSNVFISGTTYNSNPVVFDGTVSVSKGTGIKSFYANYTSGSKYTYSVFIDESSGPTSLALSSKGPVLMFPVTSSSTLYATDADYQYSSSGISVVQFDFSGNRLWAYNVSSASLTPGVCRIDIFDNVYFSYTNSTQFLVNKIDGYSVLRWTKTFESTSSFSMNVFFSQDVTFVSYTNKTGSRALITTDDFMQNIPSGLTAISSYDANGRIITKYTKPTSNIVDFINTTKNLYYDPLYNGTYFSDTLNYLYPSYVNLWGVFVCGGFNSASSKSSASNGTDVVVTGIYGPSSSNAYPSSSVLPDVERSAAFVIKVGSNDGIVKWSSYINNVVTRLRSQSVNISSSGSVYASGTYGKYRSNIYNSDGTKFDGYLPSLQDQGVYIVKYNTNGFADWQTYIDGVGTDEYNYSITNKFSNLYSAFVTIQSGYTTVKIYNAKTTGDRVPTDSGLSTTNRTGIVKYNNNGQAQWIASVNGGYYDPTYKIATPAPNDICTDSTENVLCAFNFDHRFPYLTGKFVQSNGSEFSPTFKSGSVIKMNKDGMGVLGFYLENCPGIASICTSPIDDSIFVSGHIPTGGTPGTPLNFYEWNGSAIVYSGHSLNPPRSSNWQGFIAKYSSSGVYKWSAYVIHTNPNGQGDIRSSAVGCDSNGNVYLSGYYENYTSVSRVYSSNGVAFPKDLPGTGFGTGFGDSYIGGYLTKFDTNGICQWVVILDNGNIGSCVQNLFVDTANDTITVTSQYNGRDTKFYDSNDGEHNSFQNDNSSPAQLVTYCVKYDSNGFLVSV